MDKVKPIYLMITLAKILIFEFRNKLYMRHTFWSCLIRCAEGQMDKVKAIYLMITLAKILIFEFRNKLYMRHTFWSCLIRCANMKRIQQVLLKIQSGYNSVHRRTDGQKDKVKPLKRGV